ncbi:MAG: tyrosine-type recombinase/integrase [Hyphomonadaceae bacterium]|nr:tyrosine-type recombinase/integrase [Hyphomonadaceae bacterium]
MLGLPTHRMRHAKNKLTAAHVKRTRQPGFHPDGGGLFLQVSIGVDGEPRKSWVLRFRAPDGKKREMGLGALGVVDLNRARIKADAARALVDEGKDPIEHRKRQRAAAATVSQTAVTFKGGAERFLASHAESWKSPIHRQQWENTLRDYVYPVFGDVPIDMVDRDMVLRVIEPIWSKKNETASRVRARIERVLDWAKARGLREGENPAQWRGGLAHVLPARKLVHKVRHHPALAYKEAPAFLEQLRQRRGLGARALEFAILTAVRTSEAREAIWGEIDLDEGVWTVPPARTKTGRENRVPLSLAAMEVLKPLKVARQSDFVFPGQKKGKPLSNNTLLVTLKNMGRRDVTVHGFRSTFRDWAAEQTDFAGEVAEAALAHTIKNKVEAAYRRGDLFDKRRQLFEAWAAYCTSAIKGP